LSSSMFYLIGASAGAVLLAMCCRSAFKRR
jgi:hypothetical protein